MHPGDPAILSAAPNLGAAAMAPHRVSAPVMVVAWLHIALGVAGLVAGLFFCASFWLIPGWLSDTVLAFAVPIFLFFAIFVFIPELAGGIALALGRGWGRIVIFVMSAVMLLIVPIGTVIGGFGIWVLVADRPSATAISVSRMVAPEAAAVPDRPRLTADYLAVTLLLLTAFGAAGVLLLGMVFRFREQESPSLIADLLPGATMTLPLALIAAFVWIVFARRRAATTL